MTVWLALLIPVLVVAVTAYRFRHKVVWWEPAVLLALAFVFVFVAKLTAETVQVSDTEFWGGYGVEAQYDEDWNEYISQTCTRECCCTTDSKGNRSCGTETYDCSYVKYHAPEWRLVDSNGASFDIRQARFEELARRWQNRVFVEMNRDYHTDDGDRYVARWDRRAETIETTAAPHMYENRVQASRSTFRFPDVENPKALGLFDYPPITDVYRQRVVLGADDPAAEAKFQYLNATLGRERQVRVYVLVYRNKPVDVSVKQEWHWQGGNKNEFVIAVGTDSEGNVQWARPFSWSAVDERAVRELLTDTRMKIVEMGRLDLPALADWLYPEIKGRFRRMPFARFSYLTVEPPTFAVVLVFVLTLALSVGWAFWAVKNDHVSEGAHDDGFDALRYTAGGGHTYFDPRSRRLRRRR